MTYIIYSYPPNGPQTEHFREDRREFATLDQARKEAKKRLGKLDRRYHWRGFEAHDSGLREVEAYHESDQPGRGGVQISMPVKSPRTANGPSR